MKYVKYTESPKLDDIIGFTLETYGDNGILNNPYTVEQITIYYIEKNARKDDRVIETQEYNPDLEQAHTILHDIVQNDPSDVNINKLKSLKTKMIETAKASSHPFSNAKIVMSTISPIWTRDLKSKISNIKNEQDKPINGKFLFLWKPEGMREGTYLIRWDWKNSKDGKLQSSQKLFTLYPTDEKINSIYRKFVPREKYNFLFDKYVPPMYLVQTTPADITPKVLVSLY